MLRLIFDCKHLGPEQEVLHDDCLFLDVDKVTAIEDDNAAQLVTVVCDGSTYRFDDVKRAAVLSFFLTQESEACKRVQAFLREHERKEKGSTLVEHFAASGWFNEYPHIAEAFLDNGWLDCYPELKATIQERLRP